MKRTVAALVVAVVAFLVADKVRALGQNAVAAEVLRGLEAGASVFPFTPWASTFMHIAVFAAIYFAVGAAVGWVLRAKVEAPVIALAVGLASPLSTLLFGPPAPFTWSTHAPAWLELVYWANWYVPPIAALAGALVVKLAARDMPPHAA